MVGGVKEHEIAMQERTAFKSRGEIKGWYAQYIEATVRQIMTINEWSGTH